MADWELAYKPGLHTGIPAAEYHALDAANASFLKHFDRSPLHAYFEKTHPKDTQALDLGGALHTRLLEPELFDALYAAAPRKLDKRLKADKLEWATLEALYPDAVMLTKAQFDACLAMCDAIRAHGIAGRLLSGKALHEPTLLWRDAETGLACKARPDVLCAFEGRPALVDVKSCDDAGPVAFARSVATYRYDVQAAYYLHGADVLSPVPRSFYFVAVESKPPHAVAVYALDNTWLQIGTETWRRGLTALAECQKTGIWPGYPAQVRTLNPPAWAARRLEE